MKLTFKNIFVIAFGLSLIIICWASYGKKANYEDWIFSI